MKFRLLRADEIDCRISTCNQYGVGLLLYKDARCDQNILDETVGPFNWQRHHSRDNANCTVAIWDENKSQWIEKEDTGKESFTEKEKGLASDSFKRACFNWGIGRELYTAPNMFVFARDLDRHEQKNGKWTCGDSFYVKDIQYKDDKIVSVVICSNRTGNEIAFGDTAKTTKKETKPKTKTKTEKAAEPKEEHQAIEEPAKPNLTVLRQMFENNNVREEFVINLYGMKSLEETTAVKFKHMIDHIYDIRDAQNEADKKGDK